MNITGTGIAVSLAVVLALAFLFFGPSILTPFTPAPATTSTTMTNDASGDTQAAAGAGSASAANPDTLQITDVKVGTGAEAVAGDTVTVEYVGKLTDGTTFDSTQAHGQPFSFTLGASQVIPGWDQGVAGMKEGGQRVLVIPAALGYGAQAVGPIPANSTLIFEIQLDKVEPAAQ